MSKNTQNILQKLETEENEIKAFALGGKLIREERIEKFEAIWHLN